MTARHLVEAKVGFSTTTQSDCRSRIEQPVHWGAGCGGVVCRYRFAGRDRKHSIVVIAAFYLSFAAYFGASPHAWKTELIGVGVFLVCALCGLFSRSAIAIGYILHGLWDLSHCLSGSSLAGVSITDIPLGYGIFCSAFDFVVAAYLMISNTAWHKPGKFDPYFWRHIVRADEVIE